MFVGITCFDGSMVNKTRQQIITEIEGDIRAIEQKLGTPGLITDTREQLRKIKIKKLCVESQIATSLPIEIEGFLGEDSEEVDHDERGIIRDNVYYLGCPNFGMGRLHNYVVYDRFKDLTEILQHNTGRFLRVTIEAIPLGEMEACAKCDNRFKCLTTKVRS